MGSDIHLVVERRRWEGESWQILAGPELCWSWRDYETFAVLAGVRGSSEPIAVPRGIPADYSGDRDWLGDHSYSWLALEEVLANASRLHPAFVEWLAALSKVFDLSHYADIDEPPLNDGRTRLVFGFDS